MDTQEKSSCGVGFVASRKKFYSHDTLQKTLLALRCQEHRGACNPDMKTSDGAGIMTDIPFELLGYEKGKVAVATLFTSTDNEQRRKALKVFRATFEFLGLKILQYRDVPVNPDVLGKKALERLPKMLHAIIERPEYARTNASFDKLLYTAKQLIRTKIRQAGVDELYFSSLSANTIVYKAMTRGEDLHRFYLDLQNPKFTTRFGLFHRRFSTNTTSTWDKTQPFRLIAHNGEFNTINGNRSWAVSREKALGLYEGELIMPDGVSDSGSLNEMFEALKYRSSIPYLREIMAILMPPAGNENPFYQFWARAMEPWDGPALVAFSNGRSIGARLDRNGFRPARWAMTEDYFYVSSEAGSFHLNEADILSKGILKAGTGVNLVLDTGKVDFTDPSLSRENYDAKFDKRTFQVDYLQPSQTEAKYLLKKYLFNYTKEDFDKILVPMIQTGKEPIGSMGDTARMAIFSSEPRSFFDYFYHNFAQVTNPPLDYLRERNVTDLTVFLGTKPNIFAKKELIPPPVALELKSPIIGLGQMEQLFQLTNYSLEDSRITAKAFDTTFNRTQGKVSFSARLREIALGVQKAVERGTSIIILTDRKADYENPAIPVLLVIGYVSEYMRNSGLRLEFSLVVHSAENKATHHIATTIGMGAAAVCPYLALEVARFEEHKKLKDLDPDTREQNLINSYENGILKIMSKMGISTVRSYQSSRLYTSIGIDAELIKKYFKGVTPLLDGIGIDEIVEDVIAYTPSAQKAQEDNKLINTYLYKEHNKGTLGEKHSMTNTRSKIVHDLVRNEEDNLDNWQTYQEYLDNGTVEEPVNIRHLFDLRGELPEQSEVHEEIQPRAEILQNFGSGAMSFGAISAEAQRDIFYAMSQIKGRSNSGEGGENPYYYTEGITATSKQIASGRFGVNALYLISGKEIQIKIAQGAKPGEGGQLMGIKVDEHIAKARNSLVGVSLISPPPMHDIYSIEDLRQLIYELKQVNPKARVNVKLVSGAGVGTVAVGVAKAGADVIHISGGDGGTGAAALSSMKHAGLPWEFGLWEVHRALLENDLRHLVELRTDGGLHTGKDIVTAAILGAEGFDFGKLLLIAQGCVMARICEKNTCPTGIATHDLRFKKKYKGRVEHIVKMLEYLAEDVRINLHQIGEKSLKDIIGNTSLLKINKKHYPLLERKRLSLDFFLDNEAIYTPPQSKNIEDNPFYEGIDRLNEQLVSDAIPYMDKQEDASLSYKIEVTNRATLATLSGEIAKRKDQQFRKRFQENLEETTGSPYEGKMKIDFEGSAGQGFGAFLVENLEVRLKGEANDSVGKSMSGGRIIITPQEKAKFNAHENVIIGNVAIYGATGGRLYVNGLAGDRFAVRNSGVIAVVEGLGLHACEYMTGGKVIILGNTSDNIGGGMTGGEVILYGNADARINTEYLQRQEIDAEGYEQLKAILEDYLQETNSSKAREILEEWSESKEMFFRYRPINLIKKELVEVPEEKNKKEEKAVESVSASTNKKKIKMKPAASKAKIRPKKVLKKDIAEGK